MRIRVDEELGRIEAQALLRPPGTVRAQAVELAFGDTGNEAVVDVAGPLRQGDAPGLLAVLVEQAQLDALGIGREDRDLSTPCDERNAERLGTCLHRLLDHGVAWPRRVNSPAATDGPRSGWVVAVHPSCGISNSPRALRDSRSGDDVQGANDGVIPAERGREPGPSAGR